MAFISVFRRSNGEKVNVPEHWMKNPRLSKPFCLTPVETETEKVVVESPTRGKKKEEGK